MKIYSQYGFREFVICLGYKGHLIKNYFSQYLLHHADVTIDLRSKGAPLVHRAEVEPWKVTLVDTGESTMTGGRLKRIRPYIGDAPFLLTYGDGLARIDIASLVRFHRSHHKLATVTATQPAGRFGALQLGVDGEVNSFMEKPKGDGGWVNAGFFVMQPEVFDYIEGDETVLEGSPLSKLSADRQLMAYKLDNFWHPMDTMKDKEQLESLWNASKAPWKIW